MENAPLVIVILVAAAVWGFARLHDGRTGAGDARDQSRSETHLLEDEWYRSIR